MNNFLDLLTGTLKDPLLKKLRDYLDIKKGERLDKDFEKLYKTVVAGFIRTRKHLDAARAYSDEGHAAEAEQHAEAAVELIEKTGYHRRDGEVALCRAQVSLLRGEHTAAQAHLQEAKAIFALQGIHIWDRELVFLSEAIEPGW